AVMAMEQPAFQAVFVVGHGTALEARPRRLASGHERRGKVFGFVDHVRTMMAAADILVTKAGGLTLAEALAAELPVICFGSLPGREVRNERFAAMTGVGLVASSGEQLQRGIVAAIRHPRLLNSIRHPSRLSGRGLAREEMVGLVLVGGRLARERAS